MRNNEVKAKLKRGEPSIGTWLSLPDPTAAQLMAHVGFDWDSPDGAFEKIQEEIGELKAAIESGNKKDQAAELGDLLFSIVNFARLSNFRAEEILIQGVEKFECRFRAMEKAISEKGKEMTEMSLEELDAVWDEMKSGD